MKQKIITSLFIFLFFLIFGGVFGNEYFDFYTSQRTNSDAAYSIQEELENFSLSDITDISSLDFFVTPSEDFLDEFVKKLESAQKRIYVEVYIFTEKRSREALIAAQKRGVEVQVLLEKNPYMAPNLNNETYNILEKAGIDVRWSNTKIFSLNHAKFYLIDDELILSSGNLSYSTFTKNRDLFLVTSDTSILSSFENIFSGDFAGVEKFVYEPRIILSPLYSRAKITDLISSAEKTIDMYFQYLSDDDLQTLLELKEKNNIQVRIIMDKDFLRDDADTVSYLREAGLEIFAYDGTTMHAKAILVDEKILYVGSVNFSTYSFDSNREAGLLVTNPDIISDFLEQFLRDTITRDK